MLPFNPFSAITSKIYGAAAIAALVVAGAQTLRIEGAMCRTPAAGEYSRCLLTGLNQRVSDREVSISALTAQVASERAAHQQTKLNYAAAQAEAARLEAQRLGRVKAQQQEITDEARQDYARRLADARAAADRLRGETATAGERVAGAGGSDAVPAAGDAARGADGSPADRGFSGHERLVATEQAIQLDALITWVERQAQVSVAR